MSLDETAAPSPPLRPSMRIAGRYELIERLGGGGMGEVFRARDLHLRREVAIKRLLPHLVDREDLLLRSEREGQILASLRHPAIIDVYDMLDSPDGGKFLILELVPGRSFAEELRATGRLPWSRCADIGIQVCGALMAAHAASVIHRDIKPANILVSDDGSVHVADFGIARLSTAPTATAEGSMVGTPDYWAPEQATRGEITALSDIYSLCCVLFEAACGRPPFVADQDASPAAVFVMHVVRPVPDPHEIAPDLPEEARQILMRGLAKEPSDRFESAAALAAALRDARDAPATVADPSDDAVPGAALVPGDVQPKPLSPPPVPAAELTQDPPVEVGAESRSAETAPPQKPEVAPPPTPATQVATSRNALTAATPSARNDETIVTPAEAAPALEGLPRRTVFIAAGVAAAILVGAGVGAISAPTRTPDAPEPIVVGTKDVSAGHLHVLVPQDWTVRPAADGRARPFEMRNAVELRPPGAEAGQVVVLGTSTATGAALVPQGLSGRGRTTVQIGGAAGYRYTGIRAGGRPVTAFVVPSTDGVTTVLCPAGSDGGLAATSCNGIVASMRLVGASAFPLGPGVEQAKALRRVLGRTDSSLARVADIASATSASGQSAAARSIAAGLREALEAIPGTGDASPALMPTLADLRQALTAQASAFDDLAEAAAATSSTRWSAASAGAGRGDALLAKALSGLRAAGYSSN